MDNWLRVDTHVHLHDCFDDGAFLDAAADNIIVAKTKEDTIGAALCFTETRGVRRFDALAKLPATARKGQYGWSFSPTDEDESLLATDERGRTIAIIAGRQIACREGIEVLAIGDDSDFADGEPVREVLNAVTDAGAIPVLPWGFLKWSGRRGQIVDELLRDAPSTMLLGDNGARLAGTAVPRQFAEARQKGIAVLPGTDPFPFTWDMARVGSYGLLCDERLSKESPFADFKDIVLRSGFSAESYGRTLGLLPFVRNQVAIQVRKIFRLLFG